MDPPLSMNERKELIELRQIQRDSSSVESRMLAFL